MTHPHEDQLLELSLGLLEESAERELREHLLQCQPCSTKFEALVKDQEFIGNLRPIGARPRLPRRARQVYAILWKAAALLLLGFLGGWKSAKLLTHEPVTVVPAYINYQPPADSLTNFVIAEATATTQS